MYKKCGLIGYGYWGSKLARCLDQLGVLQSIYDTDQLRGEKTIRDYPHISSWHDIDALFIATPPETHYEVAKMALEADKNVFIEKPMTTEYMQAMHLTDLATQKGLNLMVGHIYLHNGGIKAMPIPVGRAELYVQLLNEGGGPSPSTRDIIWAGLPHACSLALHFFPDGPETIQASRRGKDRIRVTLNYWNGSVAFLDLGDNTGRKLRRVELDWGASRYFFDVKDPNLCFLQSGIEVKSFGVALGPEPLLEECKAFLGYQGVDPMGPKVVKLIEEIITCLK